MIDNILISVILPVYNGKKFLSEAIESILTQTYCNFEFIIINDGSTDDSLSIINKYAENDKRIIIINRINKGLVYTLNEGIEKARGKYIVRMDADDICMNDRFEKQLNFIEKNNLDICGSNYFTIDKYSNINNLIFTPLHHKTCFLSLFSKVPFAHPSVMIRKSFLNNNNLNYGQSDYKIAEDLDLWIRLYNKGALFGNVNEILFKYRLLDNSLSDINKKGISKDTKKILNDFFYKNKNDGIKELEKLHCTLNNEEKSLVVRFVYKVFIKTFNFNVLKHLKKIDKKTIVCSILSEIVN